MADRLPPLNSLRALEVAARHLSFSKAAEELHVTPTAISHQIRSLEEFLGVQLFHRLNRALALTEAGQAALPKLQEGFTCLAEGVRQARLHNQQEVLTLWAPPSFTAMWLLPRLPRFAARHPGIDLRISATSSLLDTGHEDSATLEIFRRQGLDVAVGFGWANHPGCRVDKLFSASVVPLCSPRLLAGEHPLRQPEDLRYHTLIHDDTAYTGRPDWKDWLKVAGVTEVDATRGLHFNHLSLALRAAINGQGVVLGIKPLAAEELAAGNLIIPFAPSLPLSHAYYLVCPAPGSEEPRIVALREWLLDEARLYEADFDTKASESISE